MQTSTVTLFRKLAGALLLLAFSTLSLVYSQGVTTASLNGFITDGQGHGVAGITVTAVHVPTNTTFTATTGDSGHFQFANVPVGGPYTVSAAASGFAIQSINDVQTTLGEAT